MAKKAADNRRRIIAAADQLFYRNGYNQTAFSEVAKACGIPKGNFYYYFKSKDELLEAVIEARMDGIRAMLDEWSERYPEPRARLKRYADILLNEARDVARFGCPMGSLNIELGKSQLALQSRAAEMFDLFLGWLEQAFMALDKGSQARPLALHLLALSQGAALIGNVYHDEAFIRDEVQRLHAWIDAL